ncbi:GNAT family protein [Paenibacillus sp. M1]|uniref:GNAT family protein n=1 Tax=Paenibacillus haidiansis TaxID=1574488 RepID=A0ABU7VR59_9BACL
MINNIEELKEPHIEGRNIYLRKARESDLDDFYSYIQDSESTYLTGTQREFTLEEIAAWIKIISGSNSDRIDLMICLKQTNELLGEVVLNEINSINRSANIRIGISGAQHRGKGYGSEAIILMLEYGFNKLNLHRIELSVYDFNPRAIHVYEKIGFKREGLHRDVLYLNGKFII